MTDDRQTKNAASEGTGESPCSIPAFPHPGTWNPNTGEAYHAPEGGMTLRDWFAGQALAGAQNCFADPAYTIADLAYKIADAMMASRESNAEAHGRAVARTVQPLVGSSGSEGP